MKALLIAAMTLLAACGGPGRPAVLDLSRYTGRWHISIPKIDDFTPQEYDADLVWSGEDELTGEIRVSGGLYPIVFRPNGPRIALCIFAITPVECGYAMVVSLRDDPDEHSMTGLADLWSGIARTPPVPVRMVHR